MHDGQALFAVSPTWVCMRGISLQLHLQVANMCLLMVPNNGCPYKLIIILLRGSCMLMDSGAQAFCTSWKLELLDKHDCGQFMRISKSLSMVSQEHCCDVIASLELWLVFWLASPHHLLSCALSVLYLLLCSLLDFYSLMYAYLGLSSRDLPTPCGRGKHCTFNLWRRHNKNNGLFLRK